VQVAQGLLRIEVGLGEDECTGAAAGGFEVQAQDQAVEVGGVARGGGGPEDFGELVVGEAAAVRRGLATRMTGFWAVLMRQSA
jgi:hypothetical protein